MLRSKTFTFTFPTDVSSLVLGKEFNKKVAPLYTGRIALLPPPRLARLFKLSSPSSIPSLADKSDDEHGTEH